ncbi:hypothetical protein FRB91_000004 [Serendipita sp. 411]|nr:hypothetical protein FRC18_011936 [Serendipita sp. 400]KAG8861761.1 hypothetical protein FRB91_000004 [Serendipita sp. 411]
MDSISEAAAEPESIVVHPIQRCNDDILSIIFEWLTRDHSTRRIHRAAPLLKVCRRWRQVALQTPEIWRHFDIDLICSIPLFRKQWDWLVSMRPVAPDSIHFYNIKPGYMNHALFNLWSHCGIFSLEKITLLEFLFLRSSTLPEIANPAIALPNTLIDCLWVNAIVCINSYSTRAPWEIDQLLERFPHVRYLRLTRLSNFSFQPRNVFLNTTYLHIRKCVEVSILPGLSSFVNLEKLQIEYTTIPEKSVVLTTTIRLPALRWLSIYESPWFPWTKLDCPSLHAVTGEESVSDPMIQFLERHPHVREIDLYVKKYIFARFVRAVPHVEILTLGGYIGGLVEWQTTTDLVESPFSNLKRLNLAYQKPEIWLDLFESIVKTYCLPSIPAPPSRSQSPLHLAGEPTPRRRAVECFCVFNKEESSKTAKWAQSSLLSGCVRPSHGHLYPESWICFEFRWPESNQSH